MPEYFTKEGLEKLKQELEYLKTVKVREVAQKLKTATSFGDLSENAAYSQAKDEQAFMRGRIQELEKVLASAKIISNEKASQIVEIGSTVTLMARQDKEVVQIVGIEEANPMTGKISYQSPLGKELLNKTIGEQVQIGKNKYKISKIN